MESGDAWYSTLSYSYTTSCGGLSGIHKAVIELEAKQRVS